MTFEEFLDELLFRLTEVGVLTDSNRRGFEVIDDEDSLPAIRIPVIGLSFGKGHIVWLSDCLDEEENQQ